MRPSPPLFSFQKQPSSPEKLFSKIATLKLRKIPLETPTMDFFFGCRVQNFISTEIELLPLELWSSYFSKYLEMIVVTKSSRRGRSIKKVVLKNFIIFIEKLCWIIFLIKLQAHFSCNSIKNRLQYCCFPVNITKFLRAPILETSDGCFSKFK